MTKVNSVIYLLACLSLVAVGTAANSQTAPIKPRFAGPAGNWSTSSGSSGGWGDLTVFSTPNNGIIAIYNEDNGSIFGALEGNALKGDWVEANSAEDCDKDYEGRGDNWGEVVMTFNNTYTTFSAKWGYCRGAKDGDWYGTRIMEPAAEPEPDPDPISVEIIKPESPDPLDEIAIGSSFRVRLTYSDDPGADFSETVTITTPGDTEVVRVSGEGRLAVGNKWELISGPILVTPTVQP